MDSRLPATLVQHSSHRSASFFAYHGHQRLRPCAPRIRQNRRKYETIGRRVDALDPDLIVTLFAIGRSAYRPKVRTGSMAGEREGVGGAGTILGPCFGRSPKRRYSQVRAEEEEDSGDPKRGGCQGGEGTKARGPSIDQSSRQQYR
ncbi:hypothetical protein KM043_009285 [Ampulex compressa]|nr:hypothetical protein KM043_009285 [Ampulex compressa]